jgi:hypothetical protein
MAKKIMVAIDGLVNEMMGVSPDDVPTWDEIADELNKWHEGEALNRASAWNTYNGKYEDERVVQALINLGYLAPKKKRTRFTAEATEERVTEIDALLLERGFSRKELIEVLPIYIRALMPSKYQYSTAGDRSLLPIYDDE